MVPAKGGHTESRLTLPSRMRAKNGGASHGTRTRRAGVAQRIPPMMDAEKGGLSPALQRVSWAERSEAQRQRIVGLRVAQPYVRNGRNARHRSAILDVFQARPSPDYGSR